MGEPAVTVIIPVGPRHAAYLPDALHSLMGQRIAGWEALVVNDTGAALELPAMPGVRVLPGPEQPEGATGPARASRARNLGLAHARAPWCLFLDADDVLCDEALAALLRGALRHPEAGYVYGAWWNLPPDGVPRFAPAPAYDRARLIEGNLHPISALVPTEQARQVGGFDPRWDIYEDWEFWLRLGLSGCCGQPVSDPIIVYRNGAGSNRDGSYDRRAALVEMRSSRYGAVLRGEKAAVGCCGSGSKALAAAQAALGDAGLPLGSTASEEAYVSDGERVRLEYTAEDGFSGSFRNPFGGSGERYRVSPGSGRYISAHPADVPWLLDRGFTRVRRPAAPPPLAPLVEGPPPITAADAETVTPAQLSAIDVVAEGTEAESVAPRRRGRKAE